jgi:surface polysaccharide O-acyltransferase-like enzyme
LTTLGVTAILFYLIDLKPGLAVYKPLRVVGESSLLMYILHLVVIQYVLVPLELDKSLGTFLLIYVFFAALIILAGYGLRKLKTRFKPKNQVVKFFLGA